MRFLIPCLLSLNVIDLPRWGVVGVGWGVREPRERHRHRQTDRQRHRQTERERESESESESEWFIEKGRGPMSVVVTNTVKQL